MGKHIAIVGAGFSGTALALQLANLSTIDNPLSITLLDPQEEPGAGLAYGTADPWHRLNVPAGNMSLFPGQPNDFLNWARLRDATAEPGSFLPRPLYGEYLRERLKAALRCGDCTHIRASVVRAEQHRGQWHLALDDGQKLASDCLVLALGHPPQGDPLRSIYELRPHLQDDPRYISQPWPVAPLPVDTDSVLMLGTGLTMVDQALSLFRRGFQGTVTAVSRRGLRPQPHRVDGGSVDPAFGKMLAALVGSGHLSHRLRNFRALLDTYQADLNWQSAMNALRPETARIWQGLDTASRLRFVRHLRPYWDSCRHRLAPDVADELHYWRSAGRLNVLSGRVVDVRPGNGGLTMDISCGHNRLRMTAGRLLNCTGPDYRQQYQRPLESQMMADGYLWPDLMNLGFRCRDNGMAVNQHNEACGNLYLIGAARKGQLWESTAVPELRGQAEAIATTLARRRAMAAAS